MALLNALSGARPQRFEACRGTLGDSSQGTPSSSGRRVKPVVLVRASTEARPATSPTYATTKLGEVVRALRHLLASTDDARTTTPLITLYRTVDNLVHFSTINAGTAAAGDEGIAAQLYDRVKMELERAAGAVANVLRSESSSAAAALEHAQSTASPEVVARELVWLRKVAEQWRSWNTKIAVVEDALSSLDRYHVPAQGELMRIRELSYDILKNKFFEDEQLAERLHFGLATVIDAIRIGSGPDTYEATHATLLEMATQLGHLGQVQRRLLDASMKFFEAQSQEALTRPVAPGSTTTTLDTGNWVSQYLDVAQGFVTGEENRAAWLWTPTILCSSTIVKRPGDDQVTEVQVKALRIVEECFIINPLQKIIEGLPSLLDQTSPKLEILYQLLARPGFAALPPLRVAFAEYIKARASTIVLDKDRDDEMIDRILDLKTKMDNVVRDCWRSEAELARGLKDAMEAAINRRARKPAEMIAKYVDAKLKSGNKTMTDAELEHALNEALILFRYVSDKDMFEEVYKRHFAKRLLLNQSASSDAEQSMLLRLKDECGPGFTQQLETMLKDIALSTEIMQAYSVVQEKARAEGRGDPFDLQVFVLTQAHWPTYAPVEAVIPGDMAQALERFAGFYQTRNSGRKLSWQHSLGTNIVKAHIGKAGEKELLVSTFQTIVLLLFNDLEKGQTLSYKDIESATRLEPKELKRTLQSLACGQIPTRVLRKVPQGKDVNETDEFHVNEGWKNERHRIRINQIQMKETEEEQQQTEARVLVDRELVLQAAAVRILKAKKTIKHNELVNEIIDQVKNRFAVDVGRELKRTFELLIEKDYMERVDGDRSLYRYVA